MPEASETDIDLGRKVLARFSPLNIALSFGVFVLFVAFVAWRGRPALEHLALLQAPFLIVAALITALALSGPIVGTWRLLTGDGAAVWVSDNRLYWSPWGSIALDDLTGVRPAHWGRGSSAQILLDRRSSRLSPTIHTTLYAIGRDDLIRAIEALKPGLRYPDEPV